MVLQYFINFWDFFSTRMISGLHVEHVMCFIGCGLVPRRIQKLENGEL